MSEEASEAELLALVKQLNEDPAVNGILVQLPLPAHMDPNKVIATISPPGKDVDGFTPINMGNLLVGLEGMIPCTPYGIMELLRRSGIETEGKHAVVVGRSNIVGKPSLLLHKRMPRLRCVIRARATFLRLRSRLTSWWSLWEWRR